AGERDHLADVVRKAARELARVDAAEAPADQAELPPVPRAQRREPLAERRGEPAARPEAPTAPPAVALVAAPAARPPQGLPRAVRTRLPTAGRKSARGGLWSRRTSGTPAGS